LTNLVENAVKFTETGEILVAVALDGKTDQESGRAHLEFNVKDTGSGIDADVLPALFEPFTQADSYLTRQHEGTGLGLAICQRLVELMGGKIWAKSTSGQGSTFSFTVVMETQKEEKPRIHPPLDLYGLKSLVVDDSDTARQVLVDLLESFTFKTSSVDSGEKAIQALEQASTTEPYQLVLLDWKMPGHRTLSTGPVGLEDARHGRHRNRPPHPRAGTQQARIQEPVQDPVPMEWETRNPHHHPGDRVRS
jgi:CheY-like chemotaxis protein